MVNLQSSELYLVSEYPGLWIWVEQWKLFTSQSEHQCYSDILNIWIQKCADEYNGLIFGQISGQSGQTSFSCWLGKVLWSGEIGFSTVFNLFSLTEYLS